VIEFLVSLKEKREPGSIVVNALTCLLGAVLSSHTNQCEFFSDLNRALRSTQPQMGTKAIWELKAACVCDANTITPDRSRWLRNNMVTNTTFPYAPQGVMGILTYLKEKQGSQDNES
jgi:hypothetical protein